MKAIPVTCAIIIHQNKILVAKRSSKMSQPGFWEFPGGKIENNESKEDCLKREILEELGIVITVKSKLTPSIYEYSSEKVIQLFPFICDWESGDLQILEHEKVMWVAVDELQNLNLAPADIPICKELSHNWQAFRSKSSTQAK
ncbi:(deoxy)nucleoside triphosphate pyrophosphohydrolase [Algoriphagus sp.]|uniref:(deoxy)nucleoside triphosphate pyrophosphohydrolase n=1 Tax=Algoriphagus sp. TaxID=1872435 RepID=UPI0025D92D8B|nr:(deoxy)nucleoside triphosphate pyrophosphohydrolase [Algoriphagus sp.]